MNIDFEYGLVYNDFIDINSYKTSNLKFRDIILRSKIISQNFEISKITILPVKYFCYGSCPFCYNKALIDTQFLTVDSLHNKLLQIQKTNTLSKNLKIRLFGGDPLLHNDLISLITEIYKVLNQPFSIEIFLDGFWNSVESIIHTLDNIVYLEFITNSLFIYNMDFGSNYRYSTSLCLDSKKCLKNLQMVFDHFENNYKILNLFNCHLMKDTNLNELYVNIDLYYNRNALLNITIIKDELYHPSISMIDIFLSMFKSIIDVSSSCIGFDVCNLFRQAVMINKQMFKLIKITNDVYMVDPMYNYKQCTVGLNGVTITNDFIIPCFFENINTLLSMNDQIKLLCTRPRVCYECKLYGFCTHCNLSRVKYNCDEHQYIKHWQECISNFIFKNRNRLLKDVKFNGSY